MEYRRSGLLLPTISLGLWHNFGDDDKPMEVGRAITAVIRPWDHAFRLLDRLDFTEEELAEIDRWATESDINLWADSSRE
jgi:aryl-alcohol dehydrogenase-like predicted oxidoreductase